MTSSPHRPRGAEEGEEQGAIEAASMIPVNHHNDDSSDSIIRIMTKKTNTETKNGFVRRAIH